MIKILQIGQKYNEWEVIEFVDNKFVTCKCACGTVKNVRIHDLINNKSKRCISCANKLRGSKTHGQSNTRLYRIWKGMKRRCTVETCVSYQDYGGRNISVCDEWNNFEIFYKWALNNGYSDKLSIDRINNNGNYEPLNCRWTSKIIQNNNTRRNCHILYNGKNYTISELAKKYSIPRIVLYKRLWRGWNLDRALKQKVRNSPDYKNVS